MAPMRIHEASTRRARLRGFAWRRSPPDGAALLFERCRSVHTFGMRWRLDLVWLDAAGAVVRVDRDVPPLRVRSCRRARSVIEVPAGGADAVLAALQPVFGPPPCGAVPPALCSCSPSSSSAGGCPSCPSSDASRPNSRPTVQSVTSRRRRLKPGIIARW
jgi:uncharacterized membrane protein (UPF0127 family)